MEPCAVESSLTVRVTIIDTVVLVGSMTILTGSLRAITRERLLAATALIHFRRALSLGPHLGHADRRLISDVLRGSYAKLSLRSGVAPVPRKSISRSFELAKNQS